MHLVRPAVVLIAVCSACATAPATQTAPQSLGQPDLPLVAFETKESAIRLSRATAKQDFFALSNQFESQMTKLHCGVASSVIVLNALRVRNSTFEKPRDPSPVDGTAASLPKGFDPIFRRYTQKAFFDDKTESVKTQAKFFGTTSGPDEKPDFGFQIRQLHGVLTAHGLNAKLTVITDDLDTSKIKAEMIQNLSNEGDFVVVNYDRKGLGQKGGGHISPVAAYDEVSDAFLILDVNATAQPWVWVKSDKLFAAMRTKDTIENRGLLLVSEGS